jgi:glutathione S-transferase
MKLFYFPGACSLSVHIALCEAGAAHDIVKVDLKEKKTESGEDYLKINPKGYVPALKLDNGEVLTECTAILQYVADQNPSAKLAPAQGTFEHYRMLEWLNFIATELHKNCGALFNPSLDDAQRTAIKKNISSRLDFVAKSLQNKKFLLGDSYSIVDAYLFTILAWSKFINLDLSPWTVITSYVERISGRPAVLQALKSEGLIK